MATSLTYGDYTSSYVGFFNYMNFSVYIIEKLMKRKLKSAHTTLHHPRLVVERTEINGDGGRAKKERKIPQQRFSPQVNIKNPFTLALQL